MPSDNGPIGWDKTRTHYWNGNNLVVPPPFSDIKVWPLRYDRTKTFPTWTVRMWQVRIVVNDDKRMPAVVLKYEWENRQINVVTALKSKENDFYRMERYFAGDSKTIGNCTLQNCFTIASHSSTASAKTFQIWIVGMWRVLQVAIDKKQMPATCYSGRNTDSAQILMKKRLKK